MASASKELLSSIGKSFEVSKSDGPVKPSRVGQFGMYVAGQWYELVVDPQLIPGDPVKSLDISLLSEHLIEPLLGVGDPRKDDRIDFVGGIRGVEELSRRVDTGDWESPFRFMQPAWKHLWRWPNPGRLCPLNQHGLSQNLQTVLFRWFLSKFAVDRGGPWPHKRTLTPAVTGGAILFDLDFLKDFGLGGVPEWLKGTGCKPVGYAYVGSNPTSSTIPVFLSQARDVTGLAK